VPRWFIGVAIGPASTAPLPDGVEVHDYPGKRSDMCSR
jgi:hypothetical protein